MLGWQLTPFRVARRDGVSRSAAAQDGAGGREERQISSLRRWVLGKAALLEPPRMHLREGRKEDCAGRELTCRSLAACAGGSRRTERLDDHHLFGLHLQHLHIAARSLER